MGKWRVYCKRKYEEKRAREAKIEIECGLQVIKYQFFRTLRRKEKEKKKVSFAFLVTRVSNQWKTAKRAVPTINNLHGRRVPFLILEGKHWAAVYAYLRGIALSLLEIGKRHASKISDRKTACETVSSAKKSAPSFLVVCPSRKKRSISKNLGICQISNKLAKLLSIRLTKIPNRDHFQLIDETELVLLIIRV